jgi:hypothetical protein
MEPWFGWSYLLGIKPVHPNGWVALGLWFIVAIPLGLGALGAFEEHPILRAICSIAFVASALAFFWLVFWKFEERPD